MRWIITQAAKALRALLRLVALIVLPIALALGAARLAEIVARWLE